MKIRSGFISNSSSSSFVVCFPKKPDSREELESFLDEKTLKIYKDYNIINTLWSQIKDYDDNFNVSDICNHILGIEWSVYCSSLFDFDDLSFLEELENGKSLLITKSLSEIIKENFNKDDEKKYIFSYSDDGEYWSIWEHDIAPDIFGKYLVKHISHH